MLSYTILRLIWWALLGILLVGFAVMDGFDLGVAMLLPCVGKTDAEKRVLINSIGPVWEGNQVWFILGGGATFAAWPMLYAVSFSGLYLAMFVVLLTFILRPVAIKYRSKLDAPVWRKTWDNILCGSAFVASLIFGVAVGNIIQGVPFYFDETLRSFYTGTFFELLNPFAILCGATSVFMLSMQGAVYLVCKTSDQLAARAKRCAKLSALLTLILFSAGGYCLQNIQGFTISSASVFDGPSNPLYKTVTPLMGAWLQNYHTYPWMGIAPVIGLVGALLVLITLHWPRIAMVFSSCSIAGMIASVGMSLFPFILPSSSTPQASLTVWDASASQMTLFNMLIATIIFLPIILCYTAWVYRVLRGKIKIQDVL